MEKDDKFYAALPIAAHLCGFIEGGNPDLIGQVRQLVFGISESVVTVRAFFDQPIGTDHRQYQRVCGQRRVTPPA